MTYTVIGLVKFDARELSDFLPETRWFVDTPLPQVIVGLQGQVELAVQFGLELVDAS